MKARAYGDDDSDATRSARAALEATLSTLLRLFAPILPFATEEAWRWSHTTSIHAASWPSRDELVAIDGPRGVYDATREVLGIVRRTKSASKQSMKAPVAKVTIRGPATRLSMIDAARADLMEAGVIHELELVEGDAELDVVVSLA